MIQVTDEIDIDESELDFDFARAGGPGGQHADRSATAVQLRFDVAHSPSLPDYVRHRLRRLAGRRMTKEGVLILSANNYRSQERNRQDAVDRLAQLIKKAAHRPKRRRRTKPPKWAEERRLEQKRRRSEKKRLRRNVPPPPRE